MRGLVFACLLVSTGSAVDNKTLINPLSAVTTPPALSAAHNGMTVPAVASMTTLSPAQKALLDTCLKPFSGTNTTCFYRSQKCANSSRRLPYATGPDNATVVDTAAAFAPSTELWAGLLVFLGILVGAISLAQVFMLIRKRVYKDKDSIASAFDGGGSISGGLTASTIVAQWTWAATLLQSSNVASKYGVSGAFWYASGATIQILLFAMLASQLRVRAPGAKTFLRVIHARFGPKTHIVYVVFAFATNLIVTAMLMTGGAAVANALIKNCPVVLASVMVAAIVACHTLIGGMGALFYVSYCCSAIILVVILYFLTQVFYVGSLTHPGMGSMESVYNAISCLNTPDKYGNKDHSYNTFFSQSGLIFGIINIVGNFGTVFVDQSYWQIAIASKPRQVVYGYLLGGLVWFAVPFGMATSMGLGYQAMSSQAGRPLLTDDDAGRGLVPAIVAQELLGTQGAFLVLVVVILAVVSTASAEVMAVTSIIVHDLYQIYFKPFRRDNDTNCCVLCGKARGRMANPVDKCECISKTKCKDCYYDDVTRTQRKHTVPPDFKCAIHGDYRRYMEVMDRLKNWCLILCSFALIPLTILLDVLSIQLGWLYGSMGVVVGSAVIPISLSVCWTRLTAEGMIAGAVGGCVAALATWLGLAARNPNGLSASTFYQNTGEDFAMLGGNLVAILGGGLICVIVSYMTEPQMDIHEIWSFTYDIDNPLYPWAEMYQTELGLTDGNKLDNRPTFQSVYSTFKTTSWLAIIVSVSLSIIMVILWPAGMIGGNVFSLSTFTNWINLVTAWTTLAVVFIILAPAVEEVRAAYGAYRTMKMYVDDMASGQQLPTADVGMEKFPDVVTP
ncbi:Urea-proton symporter DUR3 [Hypsibius exemplaris]|uniref:Urea-proton symporter DUR3 n=1 Tax=Hypsibius exemplaris TaxID=2072580 RepID=A0A1W0WYT9_HYPEX|nr:Urea-proton symporter DUR3 [Hypsibius exemplaris]